MVAEKKHIHNEEGQAIFEMIIFVPIFIFLFTVIFNVGSAINVSINQQKVNRRYFYYLSKGNSYLPSQVNLIENLDSGEYSIMGMAFIGYRQRDVAGSGGGQVPIAPCMKFSSIFSSNDGEECEDEIDRDNDPIETSFIRMYNGYGVCGETFGIVQAPSRHWEPIYSAGGAVPDLRGTIRGCTMAE